MSRSDRPIRRYATGVLTCGLLLPAVVACSTPESPAPPSSPATSTTVAANAYERQRAEGVTRLLDGVTAALVAGDRAGVQARIDDAASDEFRQRLLTIADNLRVAGKPAASTAMSTTPTTASPTASAGAPPTSTARAPRDSSTGIAGSEPSVRRPSPTSAPPPPDSSRGSALRLATFAYRLAPTEDVETPPPTEVQAALDGQGSSDSWVAPVELHYALGGASSPGIGEPEIVLNAQMLVARYGDEWKLVGDSTLLGGDAPPATPVDLPGLLVGDVATSGGTSVVASYPGTAETVARTKQLLPDAVRAVDAFWDGGWPRKAVVIVTATDDEFHRLAGGSTTDITGAAAATVYARLDQSTRVVVGQRIVLTPSATTLPAPALAVVLRHELFHAATRATTRTDAPMWLTEGVAEYVGRKGTYSRLADAAPDLADQVRSGSAPTALPADADFVIDSARALVAYQSAWAVAAFVSEKFGEDALVRLYEAVGSAGDDTSRAGAIKTSLGVDQAGLVGQWRRWLAGQVR